MTKAFMYLLLTVSLYTSAQDPAVISGPAELPEYPSFRSQYYCGRFSSYRIWDTLLAYNTNNQLHERITRGFDDAGNVSQEISELMENGSWINHARTTLLYDSALRLSSQYTEKWENGSWKGDYHWSFTYTASGNPKLEVLQVWLNGICKNYQKNTYTYNAEGVLTQIMQQRWSYNAWSDYIKISVSGNRHLLQRKNNTTGKWINFEEHIYSADRTLISIWVTDHWVNSSQYMYSFDQSGNLTIERFMRFSGGDWTDISRSLYNYNDLGNCISGQNERWINEWVPAMMTGYLYYQGEITGFTYSDIYRYEAHYRQIEGTEEKAAFSDLKVYPNPAGSEVTVSWTSHSGVSILIIDTDGRTVTDHEAYTSPAVIKVKDLPEGLYFISVKDSRGIKNKSLVVSH